ncbi:hypothetical protein [Streptomyces sp. NPDC005423]|uniref:hypothetical protein n=1 Tax=Streptomyces sp. NPDC005423 TaxID=3155343 RepID=UPI0033A49964
MPPTLTEPLSGALHELLTARCRAERNKEIALAQIAAGNRGEPVPLTRHWTDLHPAAPPTPLRLTCENILADGERVALRATVRQGRAAWTLIGELRFDAAGRIVESHQTILEIPPPPAAGPTPPACTC